MSKTSNFKKMTSYIIDPIADKYTEYEKLKTECAQLRAENAKSREKLNSLLIRYGIELPDKNNSCDVAAEAEKTEEISPAVINCSTSEEKIELFMSLFRGREDIYAKRWYSEKSGKSGYQPVCLNEWNTWLCDKRKTKCADCENRKFAPLTENVIRKHLQGKNANSTDTIGIYPLTKDECCYFLVIDFDGEGWKEDISAVREICGKNNISMLVERSRSGQGGIFGFSLRIKSKLHKSGDWELF